MLHLETIRNFNKEQKGNNLLFRREKLNQISLMSTVIPKVLKIIAGAGFGIIFNIDKIVLFENRK